MPSRSSRKHTERRSCHGDDMMQGICTCSGVAFTWTRCRSAEITCDMTSAQLAKPVIPLDSDGLLSEYCKFGILMLAPARTAC